MQGARYHIRVGVVDDSSSIRRWLRLVLDAHPNLRVVAEAGCAEEARQLIVHQRPDVLILDVDMPDMSGLEFLDRLMKRRPMPVVMFSGLTRPNSDTAIRALSLGASDCMAKPILPGQLDEEDIRQRVMLASQARVYSTPRSVAPASPYVGLGDDQIILVGSSTGGVTALEVLLSGLRSDIPPVVIAQHMPHRFLESFATRLRHMFPLDIAMVQDGARLQRGQIRFAHSEDKKTLVSFRHGRWHTHLEPLAGDENHVPAVDDLFQSAVGQGRLVGAAIMTGLGADGAQGLKALREAGATTVGQSAETCSIYGMPKAAKAAGGVMKEVPLSDMAKTLLSLMAQRSVKQVT